MPGHRNLLLITVIVSILFPFGLCANCVANITDAHCVGNDDTIAALGEKACLATKDAQDFVQYLVTSITNNFTASVTVDAMAVALGTKWGYSVTIDPVDGCYTLFTVGPYDVIVWAPCQNCSDNGLFF